MSRFSTENSRPSTSMMDISDNAQVFDEFINLGEDESTTDRFGVTLHSARKQIKSMAADALANIKWQQVGEWATGLTLSNAAQIVRYNSDWYRYKGTFDHVIVGETPEDDGGVWSLDNTDGLWLNIGDAALRQELSSHDGYKHLGRVPDYETLKTQVPEKAGQHILLKEYTQGTGYGGGEFVAVSGKGTEDGGINCVVSDSWYWKRLGEPSAFNIDMFGAVPDGKTDCATAFNAMFQWSLSQTDESANTGVRFSAGNYVLSNFTYTSYVAKFSVLGAGYSGFGRYCLTKLTLIGAADSWAITVNARMFNFSGIAVYGQYDVDSVVRNFYQNSCTGGQFIHAIGWRADYIGGKTFSIIDTLDTLFSEFYTTYTYDCVFYGLMSGSSSGNWLQLTAIELSNFNMQYHKATEASKCAIFLPRANQSMMKNGWIEHSTYPGNISEGSWTIDNLSIEGATNPMYTQYAKTDVRYMNVNGSNGLDPTQGEVGNLNGVTRPSWATSSYEQGRRVTTPQATAIYGAHGVKFTNSLFRVNNFTSAKAWFCVGLFSIAANGQTVKLKARGGRDLLSSVKTAQPSSSRFGGGETIINIHTKPNLTQVPISWYCESGGPVVNVAYTQNYTNTITVYVQLDVYVSTCAFQVDIDGPSRLQSGTPFYWTESLAAVSDITAVDGIKYAPSVMSFNNGSYGFGMNMDDGIFAIDTPITTDQNTSTIKLNINGVNRYIQVNNDADGHTTKRYAFADLPKASVSVYKDFYCTDTAKTQSLQKVYSDGTSWRYVSDPDTVVTAKTS